VLSEVAVVLRGWHSHAWVDWWWRSWAIWSASRSRIVLTSAPAEPDTRVANGIALHLVDGHLSRVALNELDKAATLSRRNLHIGDLAESLEERAKLVLRNVAR